MKLNELKGILNAKLLTEESDLEVDVQRACGSDLMSDVLRFAKENVILITGLTNVHTLHTAEMACIKCVVFVRDKMPSPDIIEEAKESGITLFQTSLPMFETCGLLYEKGLGH